MQTVDAKYEIDVWSIGLSVVEISLAVTFIVSLFGKWSIVDAHISISNKLVNPTIAIVKIAAARRNIWMSLKRLLMLTIVSEKY